MDADNIAAIGYAVAATVWARQYKTMAQYHGRR
jgi:hypothetical protein